MMRPPNIKRTICRHHERGHCGYGISCGFAHGQHELGTLRSSLGQRGPPGAGGAAFGNVPPKEFSLQAVEAGAALELKETATIFASVSSWEPIGTIAEGEQVIAAGPPESIEALGKGYWMVPIQPRGAIDSSALLFQTTSGLASSGAKQLNAGGICYEWAKGSCTKGAYCRWPHIKLPGAPAPPKEDAAKKSADVLKEVTALIQAAIDIGRGVGDACQASTASGGSSGLQGRWTCSCGKENSLAKLQCAGCDGKRSAEMSVGVKRNNELDAAAAAGAEDRPGKGRRRKVEPLGPKGAVPPGVKEVAPRSLEEREKDAATAASSVHSYTTSSETMSARLAMAAVIAGLTPEEEEKDESEASARGLWRCSTCGELNKPTRTSCNGCGFSSDGEAPNAVMQEEVASSVSGGLPQAEGRADVVVTPSAASVEIAPSEMGGLAASPVEVSIEFPSSTQGVLVSDRWECPSCGEQNKLSRVQCNGCGGAQGGEATRSGGEAMRKAQAWADIATGGDAGREAKEKAAERHRQEAWTAENLLPTKLAVGSMAKICDLAARPELNGRIVECETFDSKAGRWTVVTIDDERFRLREANLQLTDGWRTSFGL